PRRDPTASLKPDGFRDFRALSIGGRFRTCYHVAIYYHLDRSHRRDRLCTRLHAYPGWPVQTNLGAGFFALDIQKQHRAVRDKSAAGLISLDPLRVRKRAVDLYVHLAATRNGVTHHVHARIGTRGRRALQSAVQHAIAERDRVLVAEIRCGTLAIEGTGRLAAGARRSARGHGINSTVLEAGVVCAGAFLPAHIGTASFDRRAAGAENGFR